MKHIKNILIIILALIASVVFLIFMWNKEWKPLAEMTELGYQELVPVAKATKPITVNDGQQSTEYYVVVEVETVDGPHKMNILMSQAYDEENLVTNLENYRKKKKVSGYYFYSETNGEVYFSKDIATAQEYMESRAEMLVRIVLLLNIFLIVVLALATGFGFSRLPFIPGGNWTKEQLIVCRYSNFAYGLLAVLCLAMGGGMVWLACFMWTHPEGSDSFVVAPMFVVLGLAFIALGVLFILFMKNYVVVFYPKGIVYRNAIGRTWFFTDEQVEYASVIHAYRNHSIRVQTKEKNVWLNYYCTNYNRAETYVVEKYPRIGESNGNNE